MTPGPVDWLDEGRESCLIDGVRYRRDEGERITLATDGRNYVSEGMDPFTTRQKTWWYVEAILVPIDQHPQGER